MTTPSLPSSPHVVPPSPEASRYAALAGVVLAVFLAIGLLSCGWLLLRGTVIFLPPVVTPDVVLHGEITHKIAKQLDQAMVPKQAANLERGASWLLFGDTGPRVRQGCPGWLFLADELKVDRHPDLNAAAKAQAVIDLRGQLAKRGIALMVAVVPDKSRIAGNQLCGLHRPAQFESRVTDWAARLSSAGVAVIDLAPTLQPLGAEAFLRTDTHWSEAGASAAAKAIAERIKAQPFDVTPHKDYDVVHPAPTLRPGDLVRLAGIDWLPQSLQPQAEIVSQSTFTAREAAVTPASGESLDDLFGNSDLPNMALLGTSFSRNSNFLGYLRVALGADVGSFAKDGGEFSGAAKAYFSSKAFKQTPPTFVLWEIPERDLQTPYSDDVKLDAK